MELKFGCTQHVHSAVFGGRVTPLHNSRPQPFQASKFCHSHHMGISQGSFCTFSKLCFNGPHQHHLCRLSQGPQWGAPAGHIGCMSKSPPATGRPLWRSGNARARCAGLRTPLGSCAARVRRAAESAAAPAADHGRVRDGWCYEHQCQMAPSRGRLRRARQPQLRRGASSTVTHNQLTPMNPGSQPYFSRGLIKEVFRYTWKL